MHSLNFQQQPDNPQNETCKASDIECVVGVPDSRTSKRSIEARKATPEEATNHNRHAKRQVPSLQEATEQAGINKLKPAVEVAPQNNTSSSSGLCSAADVECVAAKRDAAATGNVDDITQHIMQLQAELNAIKEKRVAHQKRQGGASTQLNTAPNDFVAAGGIPPAVEVTSTQINATNSTQNGTLTDSSVQPIRTNELGREVCRASDVECVTGGSSATG